MSHHVESLETRRLMATVRVSDFGARAGDGASDTSAIQAAINASSAGDTVLFGAGQYDVTQVYLKGSRTYQGVAGTTVASASEFAFVPQADTKDITITGFRFEGAGIGLGAGSFFSNIRITENTLANMTQIAIKLTVPSDQVIIERNTLINIDVYGAIEAHWPARMSYSYNRIIDSTHGGHIVAPQSGCKFNYNRMTGMHHMGLEIQSSGASVSQNMEVIGNVIYAWKLPVYGAMGLSIIAEGGYNTRIANNYISNSFAPGSDFNPDLPGPHRQFGPAIEAGFETGVVENNTSGGPNTFTAHVGAAGQNMLVRNNRFYGSPGYGPDAWVKPWPSINGMGTPIDQNNLKDTNRGNTPPPPPIPGDANNDGIVGLADHNIVSNNFGRSGMAFSQGDFSGNGVVDLADFSILAANFGRVV